MKTVLVICGGRSAEHIISVRSAKTILKSLDSSLYTIHLVGISPKGLWVYLQDHQAFLDMKAIPEPQNAENLVSVLQTLEGFCIGVKEEGAFKIIPIHVAFTMLHGPYGEDGTIQGLFDIMGVPYVGSGVLASALNMDKIIFKLLMQQEKIPIVPFLWAHSQESCPSFEMALEKLEASALFVKPAVMGSSVGISKVEGAEQYGPAVAQAFSYGERIIIEKAIQGQEIECSILGNDPYEVSGICEIKPTHPFYSYEAKYLDPQGATFLMNVNLPDNTYDEIQRLSQKVASLTQCRGMARVDFFVVDDQVYVNEINTIPGFTSISMYPQLWGQRGISLPQLCQRLIDYALAEHQRKQSYCLNHLPHP